MQELPASAGLLGIPQGSSTAAAPEEPSKQPPAKAVPKRKRDGAAADVQKASCFSASSAATHPNAFHGDRRQHYYSSLCNLGADSLQGPIQQVLSGWEY